jgi:glycosyltransferase involved in cell wall biosynthesis
VVDSIKVLQLAKHFFPDAGGIETVTRNISEMLIAHGIRADVLCTAVQARYPVLDLPYRVIRCQPGLRFGRNKSLSYSYVRQVRLLQADYDAILIHMPNPVAVAAALAFCTKPIIPLWHADIPQRFVRKLATPFDRALLKRAAAIIGPTPVHVRESCHAASLVPKSVVISYPFARDRLPNPTGKSAAAARVRAFLDGRRLVLSVGRLVSYKGFEILIDAAARFDPRLAAVIVGDGPLMEQLNARIAAANLADRIMLLGPVDEDALSDLLDLTHIGCLPSVTAAEMYGMVQVETMAFGKPMVSTRIPRSGVAWVNRHEETGLLVDPYDSIGLAGALNHLVEDASLYRRLALGAARSFQTDHDLGPTSNAYAELIRSVVSDAVLSGGTTTLGAQNDGAASDGPPGSAPPSN